MRIAFAIAASNRLMAVSLAAAASVALFVVLMLEGGVASAQTEPTPTEVAPGPVVVWETAIPEDWPAGQASHIIMSFEAYSADGSALSFAFRETDDTAKFSLIPAGVNDTGNYVAHLVLKEGEELDYETQSLYLIGVVVTNAGGGATELLIRLRITDVDEDGASPTPTASASPSPSPTAIPTPTDFCVEAISGNVNFVRSWDGSCLSENRPNSAGAGDFYARFFTFTLSEPASVSITVSSYIDTYMYLMRGTSKSGEIEVENDDIVQYANLNSGIEDYSLGAGSYTIEATAYEREKTGSFRLVVSGLPDTGEPQSDCNTGNAVPNAAFNPGLVADCETLLGLRDTLAGTTLLNWEVDTPITSWDGVSMGGAPRRVTELVLDENGLNGKVPSGLEALPALEVLSLSGNSLRGTLPEELSSLANLKELSIDSNQLTGAIPVKYGLLANLEVLELGGNRLSASIPVELGDLPSLETLVLSDNQLTGTIPVELGNLTKLEVLAFANNRLIGAIPVEFVDLDKLVELKLAGNSLSGCIPPELQVVADNDLSETGLDACVTGACSSGVAVRNPSENARLVADCNALLLMQHLLAGSARLNWSADVAIESWEGVTVSGNPKRVTRLELINRGLSGRLPSNLDALSGLRILWLAENQLAGHIPSQIGGLTSLQWLNLSGNQLSGAIPPDVGDLTSLEIFDLNDNRLSGEIPPELGSLASLKTIYLQNNILQGAIPSSLGALSQLGDINLSNNLISGEIPKELGELNSLETLDLDDNLLSGSIPIELGNLSSLEHLHLTTNRLSGEIPRELGSLEKLEALHLSGNLLTGEIPAELGAIASLVVLRLAGNDLGGCIPKELRDVTDNDFVAFDLMFCNEGACAGGTAVESPNDNRGLVGDCQALIAAKEALSDTVVLNWSTETSIQNWRGISITGDPMRVTKLDLSGQGLDGTVPGALGNLAKLETLDLSGNMLTGEIPAELVKLSNLEVLSLANNKLTGQIPHELGRLSNIKEIYLSGTGHTLTGCVPDGLEAADKDDFNTLGLEFCDEIDCSSGLAVEQPEDNADLVADCVALLEVRDALAGSIYLNWSPQVVISEWAGVTVDDTAKRVTEIALDNRDMNGVLPSALGKLSSLEKLSLISNHLSGDIPSEVGRLASLEELSLSGNLLSGSIPSELGRLTRLKKLLLDNNQLTGEIPHEFSLLTALKELTLAGNSLSGCVPESLEEVATNDFQDLGLGFCESGECSSGTAIENPDANPGLVADCDVLLALEDMLKGDALLPNWSADVDIDDWFGVELSGSPRRVTSVVLSELRLSGEIPADLSRLSKLKTLSLGGNRLTGEIPIELSRLSELEVLSLSHNRLSGIIPPELSRLSNLETLSLSGNLLSGQIPSDFERISSLKSIYLYDNRLSGPIPVDFGNLSNLVRLHAYGNDLTGTIPTELAGLENLRDLRLSQNDLTGNIPSEFGALSKLVVLHLSNNKLTGQIPSTFEGLSILEELYLSHNRLTGNIPAELADLTKLKELYLFGNELTGCIPAGLKDVESSDLSLLNLPDCEAESSLLMSPWNVIESHPHGETSPSLQQYEATIPYRFQATDGFLLVNPC